MIDERSDSPDPTAIHNPMSSRLASGPASHRMMPSKGERPLIPLAAPVLAGNEKRYVIDCLETSWISSNGEYVGRFEKAFADYCGARHAIACCNGTAALHIALQALGIGPGDEVLVPTLTFVASANAVYYCGARPVFIDAEPATWNLDPTKIEASITKRTKAIIAVHLYGYPAEMDAIRAIAERHRIVVVEDAAQAHGARYRGAMTGTLGKIAAFSFFGNKILSTGEGGMVVTDDGELASRVRLLRGQGMDPTRRYWFPIIGYNYRMTNIAAAIGLGQLESVDWHVERRLQIVQHYVDCLKGYRKVHWQSPRPWVQNANWLFTVTIDSDVRCSRDSLMARLADDGIETRPIFPPMHALPPYHDAAREESFPVADRISRLGVSLPTSAGLALDDVTRVCDAMRRILAD